MGYVVWVVKGEPRMSETSSHLRATTDQQQTIRSIYNCLEMLRLSDKLSIVDYWVNLLYDHYGNPSYGMWSEHTLGVMENDVIYNV